MIINCPADAYKLIGPITRYRYERLGVILLDEKRRVIKKRYISTTSNRDSASFHIKHIFWFACANKASGIIVYHNHPSGICTPSVLDKDACQQILAACNVLGIVLADFMIAVKNGYYSFREVNLV